MKITKYDVASAVPPVFALSASGTVLATGGSLLTAANVLAAVTGLTVTAGITAWLVCALVASAIESRKTSAETKRAAILARQQFLAERENFEEAA